MKLGRLRETRETREGDRVLALGVCAGILLAILLASCASRGREFSVDSVPLIQRGVTTQEDVKRLFGEPTTIRARGSGVSAWGYLYEETETADTRMLARVGEWIAALLGQRVITPPLGVRYENVTTHELQVYFDTEGIVSEYEYKRRQLPTRRIN